MDKFTKQLLGTKTQQDVTPNGFNQPRSRFYNSTIRNYWEQGGALAPIIPHPYKSKGTPIFRDTTDSNLFNDGGKAGKSKYYTYKDHRDQYMKKGNQWYISNEFTDFNFQPIKDPKGTRAKELNKNAKEFPIDEGKTFEAKVNKALGNPMDQAYRAAEYFAPPGEDPIDNFRHPIAGRYATEAISNYVNSGYPIIDKAVGFIGANAMGVGHELNTLLKDKRPWSTKLPEAGEDIYNNFIGTTIGVSSMTPRQKTNYLLNLSDNNQLPDGYGPKDDKKNMYWKDQQGRGSYNSKLKNGGELLAQPYPNSFFASDLKSYYADGGPLHDRDNESGRLLNSTYASALGRMFRDGGYFDHGYSLPEDSFKQGGRGLKDSIYASTSGQYPANYKQGGNINVVAGGEKHRVYIKKSPTGVGEGTQGHVMVNHPTMDKGQWDTIDLTEKSGAKTVAQGIAATKKWHRENPNVYKQGGSILSMSNTPQLEGEGKDLTYPDGAYVYANGGMLKRADGSYSQRGLWDNIRANRGSGKEPTKEMLRQERKIRNEKALGGVITTSQLPQANYFDNGGKPKNPKLITYKTDSKLIDGTAAFDLISKVPISDDYNQQIKERLYTGKWGFDPESGALVKLNKSQQTTVPQNISNIRKEEKEDQEYRAAIQRGEINPRVDTTIIPQANKQMTPQEVKEFVRQGYDATILNPAFQTAAYFTPPGMAIGAIQGAANLIPDLYEGNYGHAAIDAASILPFAGPLTRRVVYNAIEPAGYGVANKLKSAPRTFVKNILDAEGRPARLGKELLQGVEGYTPEEAIKMGQNRLDAWRVGLKMPQKYDTFEELAENTYRIKNMKPAIGRLSAIDKDIKAYELAKQQEGRLFNNQDELNNELQKLYQQHDDIINPSSQAPSPGQYDINYLTKYLRKSGDIKTPEWQQGRIVEKSLQPEFKHSVYDVDPQGIMGSYRWDVKKDPSGALHYQSNDTWDLNPWENRGHTKVNPKQEETNVLKRYYKKPLQNIEALSLVGGKPFKIQNNFAVNPETFEVMGKWKQGGKMHNAPILTTSMLLKRFK